MIFGPERKAPTKKEKELLFKNQSGRCMYCGAKLSLHYLDVDHKIPLSRNGSDRISNKQLICGPCNRRKGNMTDGEFRRRYPFLKSAREAKNPPRSAIPQSRFDEKDKELKDAAKRRKPREKGWFW